MDINDVKKAYQEQDEYSIPVEYIVSQCLRQSKAGLSAYSTNRKNDYYLAYDADKISERLHKRGFSTRVCQKDDSEFYYLTVYGWAE